MFRAINGSNQQCSNTLRAATRFRLNQEINLLYVKKKKSKQNEQLYTKHLECASLWPNCWQFIQTIIDNKLQTEMETV